MTDTMTLSRDTTTPIAPRQPELDLPSTLTAPVLPSAPKPRRDKGAKGLPPSAFAIAAAVIVALLWGAWVTKSIMAPPEAVPMASVRLQQLVGICVLGLPRAFTLLWQSAQTLPCRTTGVWLNVTVAQLK